MSVRKGTRGRVVVIEDLQQVRDLILEVLRSEGYEASGAGNAAGGLEAVHQGETDLVVLDLNLPERMRGLDICRALRRDPRTSHIPVLVLTGEKGDEIEETLFDAGADEYIRKNDFRPKIFLARVAAVMRRGKQDQAQVINYGPMVIHPLRREITLDGDAVKFTPTEFDILLKLASHPDRALTRRELLDRGDDDEGGTVDRTVDVHVLAIRRKLDDYSWLVATVFGVGYRLGALPEAE